MKPIQIIALLLTLIVAFYVLKFIIHVTVSAIILLAPFLVIAGLVWFGYKVLSNRKDR